MNKKSIVLICLVLLMFSGCISGKIPEFAKGPVAVPEDILGKITKIGRASCRERV